MGCGSCGGSKGVYKVYKSSGVTPTRARKPESQAGRVRSGYAPSNDLDKYRSGGDGSPVAR